MKGLELSRLYYHEVYVPMLKEKFPEAMDRMAAGLVGEGSECYGYDDEISRDHDWGPALCLWLTSRDYESMAGALKEEIKKLPEFFRSYRVREEKGWSIGRIGVFETSRFYSNFTGCPHAPKTLQEWRRIPEINLSTVTNGEVFSDLLGEFTEIRETLLSFYPEDVRLKKIAARCMQIAQSGQYNFPRSIKRKEYVAARMAEAEFLDSAGSIIFLLNRKYRPFYKWLARGMKELPILGEEGHGIFSDLVGPPREGMDPPLQDKIDLVERLCALIIGELKSQGLTDSASDFLLNHGPCVQKRIQDAGIKSISVWLD